MLVLERTFDTTSPETEALSRVRAYLDKVGFRRADGSALRFTRGDTTGSLFGTDPRRWEATLTLTVSAAEAGTRVVAVLEVRTLGQSISKPEGWFFNAELDALGPVAAGELPPEPVTEELVALARRGARIAWAIGLGFAFAAIVFLLVALARAPD